MRTVTCFAPASPGAIPVTPILAGGFPAWLEEQPAEIAAFVKGAGFKADAGRVLALPGMSGPELQHELRLRRREIPTVFITAQTDESIRPRLFAQGAIGFLLKPFSDTALFEAVDAALQMS